MLSNYLAEIWGISLVIVPLALLVKEKHLKRIFAGIEAEENFFMWGLTSFVIGLSTVLAHNIWVNSWQVVVTILGWAALLKGLSILFIPDLMKRWTKALENTQFLPFALLAPIFIGLVIAYLGFTA